MKTSKIDQEKIEEIWTSPDTSPDRKFIKSKAKAQRRHQKVRLHDDCRPT